MKKKMFIAYASSEHSPHYNCAAIGASPEEALEDVQSQEIYLGSDFSITDIQVFEVCQKGTAKLTVEWDK